jgi:hypothetical protein
MSRLLKYKESLNRFIKEQSCIQKLDDDIYNKIVELCESSDLLIPILFLTLINSQSKKHSKTIQGYHIASAIQYLIIINDLIINKSKKSYDDKTYYRLINSLTQCIFESIVNNIESVKHNIPANKQYDLLVNIQKLFSDKMNYTKIFNENEPKINENGTNPHVDILKWYIKDNNELKTKYNNLVQLDNDSYNEYFTHHYNELVELAMISGWILGFGTIKCIPNIKKVAYNFSFMYMIYHDLVNMENNLINDTNYTKNYVINYGLVNSYEKFMDNKQKFIEDCMINNIYTHTVREIVEYIDMYVDKIMDTTSPDIRSTSSCL